MRYVGGKGRIAKDLARVILDSTENRAVYLEPFLGGGSMLEQMAPHFQVNLAGDLQPDIAMMWEAALAGARFPESITEAEYAELRDAEPSALRGLVGYGGSFGGKWFGGYARGGNNADGSLRNHYGESRRSIMRTTQALKFSFVYVANRSYETWYPKSGTVVYADPPYAGTQGYTTGDFDHDKFWYTMGSWSQAGAQVFVSEYSAPAGWVEVWSKQTRQSLTTTAQGRDFTTERLFTYAQ